MKLYKIGRDTEECDIIIDDPSSMTSRLHAVLRISKKGKYSIADCSNNGTYINGIRIESGVYVPVTRKDRISFAHIVDLDWDFIPNPAKKRRVILFSIFGSFILLCIIGAVVLYYNVKIPQKPEIHETEVVSDSLEVDKTVRKDTVTVNKTDTLITKKPASVKKTTPNPESKSKPDSVDAKQHVDAIEPEKQTRITNPIL